MRAGKPVKTANCPVCGGRMEFGNATIPFILSDTVVVVKDVPAEICQNCHEPFVTGSVTDQLTGLLDQLRAMKIEVSVVSYGFSPQPMLVLAEERESYDAGSSSSQSS